MITPSTLIGLEDLTNIRGQILPNKKGKKASKKQRKANYNQAKWSFAELHGFIDYKAILAGSMATKVDAHYTSQACPCCGHTSRENRQELGLTFICQGCDYTLHADLVGARNIALRALLFREVWESTGCFSATPSGALPCGEMNSPHQRHPDASDKETKAERLKRYSQLRWSLDAIPNLNLP